MIGIFGGTFNPVHWGHVRTALELKQALAMERMLLIPCGLPPHREVPEVDAMMRLAMLKAAIADFHNELEIDERELNRTGPSYTVDTLQSLQQEHPGTSLVLCMGIDAFIHLDTWHEWPRLFERAHIIIAHRPGWPLDSLVEQLSGELRNAVEHRLVTNVEKLRQTLSGLVLPQKVTDIDISSSEIRRRLAHGESVAAMVPAAVLRIIEQNGLYQTASVR